MPLPNVSAAKPTEKQIREGIKTGFNNPLDFLKANSAPTSEPALDPQAIANEVAEKRVAPKEEVKPVLNDDGSINYDLDPTGTPDTQPTDARPAEDTEPEPSDLDTNIKTLRSKHAETRKNLKTVQQDLAATKKKLEEYETGAIVPDVLKDQAAEIERLKSYEKLLDLKMSPEYQDIYVKPLQDVTDKLEEIEKAYDLEPGTVLKAASSGKVKELDEFLSENFNLVGAVEVKNLVNQAQSIQDAVKNAEKDSGRALEALRAEHQKFNESKTVERKATIANKSRNAWTTSLLNIRAEGQILELIPKEGDTEHNDKVVKPILAAAAQQYGKLVTALAERGLEDLDDELALALARMTQLSQTAALAIHTRNGAVDYIKEIEKSSRKLNGYERPSIGSNSGAVRDTTTIQQPTSPKEAAQAVIAQAKINAAKR